jgi:hypothetical protein
VRRRKSIGAKGIHGALHSACVVPSPATPGDTANERGQRLHPAMSVVMTFTAVIVLVTGFRAGGINSRSIAPCCLLHERCKGPTRISLASTRCLIDADTVRTSSIYRCAGVVSDQVFTGHRQYNLERILELEMENLEIFCTANSNTVRGKM